MKKFFLIALLALIPSLMIGAEWKLDKNHSKIHFTIQHMVIAEVMGVFREFDITIQSSKDDFSDMRVEAVIKTNSIDTHVERRDNHLRSDDFFNAEKFPEIRFSSTSVEKSGDKNYKIHGNLTLRDVTKPVTFDAVLNGIIKTEVASRAGWRATLTINRFDYGLKWNNVLETGGLVAGELVKIVVDVEITKPTES